MKDFINQLPIECQGIAIKPRHKTALEHFTTEDGDMWVVLLTTMPGDCPKAWKLSRREYWSLQPKHGTRDRYIRENYPPTMTGSMNPPKPKQMFMTF